ncbi:hypothetical protein ACP70R_031707 [Stipagrostis hirtigluma subsp. patula]
MPMCIHRLAIAHLYYLKISSINNLSPAYQTTDHNLVSHTSVRFRLTE